MCVPGDLASAPSGGSSYPTGIAPEFHVLGPDILAGVITEAEALLCAADWGRSYCRAVLLKAAGMLAQRYPRVAAGSSAEGTGTGAAPGVLAVKTGDEARSFQPGSSGPSGSKYDDMFNDLRRSCAARAPRFYGARCP